MQRVATDIYIFCRLRSLYHHIVACYGILDLCSNILIARCSGTASEETLDSPVEH